MFAVLGPEGEMEATAPSVPDAVESAYSAGADDVIVDAAPGGREREVNRAQVMAEVSHRKMGGLVVPQACLSMTREEMWRRLARFFPLFTYPDGRTRDAARVHAVETGKSTPAAAAGVLVDRILGQNAKTRKKKGRGKAVDVQGLSLTPYWQFAHVVRNRRAISTADEARYASSLPNFCVGSSAACRHSCLVFSGQNYIDDYNVWIKFQRTRAFVEEPEAFGKLLSEACARHIQKTKRTGYRPMVRLNVFQDIPWERVMPWLFEEYSGLQFYDYTKVYGRSVPTNYDLTFSNSGRNLRLVNDSLDAGTRIALVAHVPTWELSLRRKKSETDAQLARRKHKAWAGALPKTCQGVPVVDGDESDIRPLDPTPSVVALRWKAPTGRASGRAGPGIKLGRETKFVVEVDEFCGLWAGAVTPSEEPDTRQRSVFSLVPMAANPGRRLFMRTDTTPQVNPAALRRRLT